MKRRPPGPAFAQETLALRRRLGLRMLAVGVALIGAQGLYEWLLPYDPMALQALAGLVGLPLQPRTVVAGWTLATLAGLGALFWAGTRAASGLPALSVLAGVLLGSDHVAAGGSAAALVLLLLAGVATLGWQSWRAGGGGLFGGAALGIAAWDATLSAYATLWPFCLALAALFVWIEQRHIQASDRRLLQALAERERLIGDLDAQGAELARLQAARTQLLASISHDLRQPLQAVRLYADALRAHNLSDAAVQLLQHQLHAADDAVALLDQFSEFSALEQGRLNLRDEVFDALPVLHGVAASLRATHPRCVIRVRGRAQALRGDRTQFTRIVQNLAGNAVRHAGGATSAARVLIGLRPRQGGLRLQVVDNGPGMPSDKLELIFQPYVQLAGAQGHPGGRGLGLAIVRGLADALGLQVSVRSALGRGSSFSVDVPASRMVSRASAEAPAPAAQPAATLEGRLFALLDDEDPPRLALAAALRGRGARVVEAADFERLRLALDDELGFPDALLFDLDLRADIDGLAAIGRLRDEWQTPVPAVLITGRAGAGQALSLPPHTALLAKPVGLDELAAALAALTRP